MLAMTARLRQIVAVGSMFPLCIITLVQPLEPVNQTSQASATQSKDKIFPIMNATTLMQAIGESEFVGNNGNSIISPPNYDDSFQRPSSDFLGVLPYKELEIYKLNTSDKLLVSDLPVFPLHLCGYPVFVNHEDCDLNATLSSCMSYGKAITFGVAVLIMGISIIGANVLIPILVFVNKSLQTQHYYIKASLAVADSIVGFLFAFSVIPNVVWVAGSSKEDLVFFPRDDKNSPRAITVGALLTVSVTASLLHLTYLCIERFIAITWPLRNMTRTTKSVKLAIASLWVVSLAASFVPAAFPDYFAYQFQPTLLIHTMTLVSTSAWRGVLYGVVTIIIPYIIMAAFCVMTTVVTYRKIKKSRKTLGVRTGNTSNTSPLYGNDSLSQATKKKRDPEISVFITVGIMIAAFTLTLMPFTVVMIIFVTGIINCSNYTIPYVTLFYIGMLNSLANGIIYTLRDPRFRQAVKDLIPCSKSSRKTGTIITGTETIP